MGQPHRGLLHRLGGEFAAHHAPFLHARDQARVFQHAQVLHEARQRHAVRLRELGDRGAALAQLTQYVATRRVGQCPEHLVEDGLIRLHEDQDEPPIGSGWSKLTRLPSVS